MEVDIRKHAPVRSDVDIALKALLVQARQIWGAKALEFTEIVVRLMVGVGDLARLCRDNEGHLHRPYSWEGDAQRELKKELGNIVFSTIRWINDLGYDPLECLDLAIEAQEKFAKSGRPR